MTVIAWDGKTLAADRRACLGSLIRVTRKIHPHRGQLLAFSGDADLGEAKLRWYVNGADPTKYPKGEDSEHFSRLLVVQPTTLNLEVFERTAYPLRFPPQMFAMGSGRDFALMAMHLGKTAAEAVELTSLFDSGCGNGVDVLEMRP